MLVKRTAMGKDCGSFSHSFLIVMVVTIAWVGTTGTHASHQVLCGTWRKCVSFIHQNWHSNEWIWPLSLLRRRAHTRITLNMSFSGQPSYVQTTFWVKNELQFITVATPSDWVSVIWISHSRCRDYVNVPLSYVHDSTVMFASVLESIKWHIGIVEVWFACTIWNFFWKSIQSSLCLVPR